MVFQALLRNPLATPFTLGVSAGAALGAMLAITFRLHLSLWGVSAVTAASFIGSLGAVAIVYAMARARHRGFSTNILLLAGVTLNAFFSALILFVQYLADSAEALRTMRWLMGDLDIAGYGPLLAALPLCAVAFVAFAWLPRPLNLLSLDTDAAASRGVDVLRVQRVAFFSASMATGAAVSLGGPIGFIGIIVPHLVRLLVGADHRVVLPASALFGAAFLVAADVARAHGHGAGRAARRDHHGARRRAVLPVAAGQTAMRLGIRDSGRGIRAAAIAATLLAALVSLTAGAPGLQPRGRLAAQAKLTPARIVSLVPSATEMLFAMGAGPRVAAVSSYDRFPRRSSAFRASARSSIPMSSASCRCGPTWSSSTPARPTCSPS